MLIARGAKPAAHHVVGLVLTFLTKRLHGRQLTADDHALFDLILDAGAAPQGGCVEVRQPDSLWRPQGKGFHALHLAVLLDERETVRSLLAHGAQATLRTELGWTPLHVAKSPQVVQLLLSAGADPLAVGPRGLQPLHTALLSDEMEERQLFLVAKALIHAGAQIHVSPASLAHERVTREAAYLGLSPLEMARQRWDPDSEDYPWQLEQAYAAAGPARVRLALRS